VVYHAQFGQSSLRRAFVHLRQAREILAEGKTKFFQESLPKLEAFLDGNKLKITGRSIQALIASRVKGGRKPRPTPSKPIGEPKQLTA